MSYEFHMLFPRCSSPGDLLHCGPQGFHVADVAHAIAWRGAPQQ